MGRRGFLISRAGALLLIVCACGACATAEVAGTAANAPAAGASPVLLRVDQEKFTRADLERRNPQLFAQGVTHGKALRKAFIERFVDFRLTVGEGRRRGLENSAAFRARFDDYLDAKGAEALIAELEVKEEKPGDYDNDELAGDLIGDQRRAQIRAALRKRGLTPTPTRGQGGTLLASIAAGAPADAVLVQVGQDRVTAGQLRDLCAEKALTAPTESDAARALDELVLYRDLVAAAKAGGQRERAGAGAAAADFREKLLEALLGEELVAPGSLAASAVSDYYAANGARYETLEAVRLRQLVAPEESVRDVYKRLRGGEDFAALAKQHSLDKDSAAAGGDIGWVTPQTPGIPAQAFTLKVGEISRMTKTDAGFLILRVDERRVARAPLETIAETVRRDAEADARSRAMRDLVAGLRAQSNVWMAEELTQ